MEPTYPLSRDNHGENVSVHWLVKIEFKYPLSQDDHGVSAPSGSWKIEYTYFLSQDNHGENVSVQWLVENRIHVLPKPRQPQGKCQHPVAYEKSNSRTG